MRIAHMESAFRERYPERITAIDSHTGGEATRLIIGDIARVPGRDMQAKRAFFRDHRDHVRQLLTREPRGHRDLLAAAVTDPVTPGAAFGLVYMDAKRYPHLCGHATIGAVTTLLELGALGYPESSDRIVVDTPSGPMPVRIGRDETGVAWAAITPVPAFVMGLDLPLDVPGMGRLVVDTVCVGGCFVMVDAEKNGIDITPETRQVLVPKGMAIIEAANEQLPVAHPLRPEVDSIDVVEIHCARDRTAGRFTGESVVVYGESHMDRSPCGTGTTAKTALLHARGKLAPGEEYRSLGPLGTRFTARIVEETTVGDTPAVRVEVRGAACMTAMSSFVLDAKDPFPEGFLL